MPDKLHDLQRLWLIEATRYNVLPLDDRVKGVQLDIAEAAVDADHLISPQEAVRIAMARQ